MACGFAFLKKKHKKGSLIFGALLEPISAKLQ
jgi:hypothetical protein